MKDLAKNQKIKIYDTKPPKLQVLKKS